MISRTLNDSQPPMQFDKAGRARWWIVHNREKRRRDTAARRAQEVQVRIFQAQMQALQFQREQQEKLAKQRRSDSSYSKPIETPSSSPFATPQRSNPFRSEERAFGIAPVTRSTSPNLQISRLANQVVSVVERELGPTQAVEVVPESESSLQGNLVGEHRRFGNGREWELEVQFYHSRAVTFTLVMESMPAATAEEIVARMGVDVHQLKLVRSSANSKYWAGRVGGLDYTEISAHTGGANGWTVAQAFLAR